MGVREQGTTARRCALLFFIKPQIVILPTESQPATLTDLSDAVRLHIAKPPP